MKIYTPEDLCDALGVGRTTRYGVTRINKQPVVNFSTYKPASPDIRVITRPLSRIICNCTTDAAVYEWWLMEFLYYPYTGPDCWDPHVSHYLIGTLERNSLVNLTRSGQLHMNKYGEYQIVWGIGPNSRWLI